jgi:GT2 family glycosyltransferase
LPGVSAAVDSVTPANDGSVIDWVVLTRGDRPTALAAAVASLRISSTTGSIVVLLNGPDDDATVELDGHADRVVVVESPENLGVPGGRDLGLRSTRAPLVGFLDDDARLVSPDSLGRVVQRFATDSSLGAMSLRLVDEDGNTSRRHVPRRGAAGADRSGPVATFLGGASIVRRSAYLEAGGYWTDLVYGHEELDLAWRLIGHHYSIRYEAEISVYHPRTDISRHPDGWWRTGRNRVLIARRNLPVPLLMVHSLAWLVIGTVRAPGGNCRRRYVVGWFGAWRLPVDREPLSWSALGRLRRLGRFPIV